MCESIFLSVFHYLCKIHGKCSVYILTQDFYMKITIRKARKEDLSTILRLRDDARRIMQTTGNPDQWPENYPAKQTFERDIELWHKLSL